VKLLLFISIQLKNKYSIPENQIPEGLQEKEEIMCLVQELILERSERTTIRSLKLGEKYMWAADPNNPNEFKYLFVPVETILRPVMVIPEYGRGKLIDINRPKRTDRFYMIDRKFFDRSGWPVDNLSEANDFITEENQVDYLTANYESKGIRVNQLQQGTTSRQDTVLMYESDEDEDEEWLA